MKPARGKVVFLSSGVLGIAVLLIAGHTLRDRIREEYWLWKLEKGDRTTQEEAALSLGNLRSVRAVPGILKWACTLQRPEQSGASLKYWSGLEEKYWIFPTETDYDRVRSLFTTIGKGAVPELTRFVKEQGDDPPTRFWAEVMLVELGDEPVAEAMNASGEP